MFIWNELHRKKPLLTWLLVQEVPQNEILGNVVQVNSKFQPRKLVFFFFLNTEPHFRLNPLYPHPLPLKCHQMASDRPIPMTVINIFRSRNYADWVPDKYDKHEALFRCNWLGPVYLFLNGRKKGHSQLVFPRNKTEI